MVLASQQDLTRVGPGTPAGELLRRYWLPIAPASEMTEENPIKALHVLGEGLAMFRDKSGRIGLMQERCTHHAVMMYNGHVESDSLACPLHAWRFDLEGNCFVIAYREKVYPIAWANAVAYPVKRYAGMLWAYMGPRPAPEFPRYEVLDRTDGRRRITVHPSRKRNWLDLVEDALQSEAGESDGASTNFSLASDGIVREGNLENDPASGQKLIFPVAFETDRSLCLRTPIDDAHTWEVIVEFIPDSEPMSVDPANEEPEVVYGQPDAAEDPNAALRGFFFGTAEMKPPEVIKMSDEIKKVAMGGFFFDSPAEKPGGFFFDTPASALPVEPERYAPPQQHSEDGVALFEALLHHEIQQMQEGANPMGIVREEQETPVEAGSAQS